MVNRAVWFYSDQEVLEPRSEQNSSAVPDQWGVSDTGQSSPIPESSEGPRLVPYDRKMSTTCDLKLLSCSHSKKVIAMTHFNPAYLKRYLNTQSTFSVILLQFA